MGHPKRRKNLFDKDPRCYYCDEETVWEKPTTVAQTPRAATVEHLISRLNPEHWYYDPGPKTVLACYKCNQSQSKKEQAARNERIRAWHERMKKRKE